MNVVLLSGITGQDGDNLARLLLERGCEVHGIIRRSSSFNTSRIDDIFNKLHLHYGDLTDSGSIDKIVQKVQPDWIFHLGAMSHVKISFDIPEYACDVDALGTLRLLEAIRCYCPKARFYNAASSEMFGSAPAPQNENTIFCPQSPYACAKVFSYHLTKNYRNAYKLFASNGILFNHEGSARTENFLTRKVTRAVARIKLELQEHLYLGNLEARRDWGYSKDFVEAMVMMLEHHEPDDFVIATGRSYSVKEFVMKAFDYVGLDWEKYVKIDPRYFRPSEVDHLQGDYSKAKAILGWEPKTNLDELIKIMIESDYQLARQELLLKLNNL